MSTISMTGSDTVSVNNRIFADLADGDAVQLTFPNEMAVIKTGKDGNSLYALNESGRQAEVIIRVIRGSADDKFLNGLLANQRANFASFVLMNAEFIKRIGDGQGNVLSDTYVLSGGVFSKQVEAKSNVEGDTEQSVAIYNLRFSNSPRALT
jgi:hypothetical protein